MKKIILTILILSLFFLSSKTPTFADCATNPTCICSCSSGYHKGSQTCAGTESCGASAGTTTQNQPTSLCNSPANLYGSVNSGSTTWNWQCIQ